MKESIHHTELCDLLNVWDEVATRAVIRYLEKHDLLYLRDRVIYEYSADFGVVRPLRNVWVKLLDVNPIEFIEFYEDVYRFRKAPRYEDIFITVLISIACGLAANELYERYKVWRETNKANKELHDKFLKSSEMLFEYLTKIYAIREAYLFGEISYEKFTEIRDFLKRKIFIGDAKEIDTKIEKEFTDLLDEFVEKHLSSPLNHSICDIRRMVILEHDMPSTVSRHQIKIYYPPRRDSITLRASPGVPGVACGTIKIINSIADLYKILSGDIGVFRYFAPDMVPALKRCVGAIGLLECGGLTGHLGIVGRELGVPCVLHCNYDKFSDGQVVYLDGNDGEIRIMLSIEGIRKCLQ